ncbi:Bug family tripartite tricarboxylate transporter substrate binding protein [Cupriavidus gilardii]|jgi:tripartite-type tricarboxylate transporter receptor subunit TctC|uniref:Tripartite tricarboxylate transporter substrate binding protein n=1 Tax=Cupriavidus gilardii TaxID=82541 RepID=A0ABY4VKU8_9BURK|nr:tripartite tricarboxylate transporter substrate binding protein [Cupriavidus gilardii]MCT9069979.1 tripartite tricarboxylate transporter substrate binding protein [Cupriavidus gilardii]QKS62029.1 tripartite tricarboxylate transporter substrate binding protein [Cupriavidus gilardii]USE76932.1 tripartite tricarboxylate transporter substrate binding protein [Cupriavidus gilardii]UXC37848.1 tripartite tricarboxylate transporter substrate binding protein [Cupriavidus gilardii]
MDIGTRRRQLLTLPFAAGAVALASPWRALASGYPSKPIRMVVPFPAGGPTDIVARPFAQSLGEALKQSVVVDNRGGAGGSIGAGMVATAAADGYTLLMGTVGTSAINASLYKNLSYHPVKDFTPIAAVATAPVAIVVHPGAGIGSLAELVSKAKARPKAINYGSAGNGTPGHLAAAMFCATAHIELTHVPYKGSAPAVTELLGGQIPLMFDPLQSVLPHIQSGKLKALAITSRQRASVLPDVPTVAESGFAEFEATAWWALFAPAGLAPAIAQRLRAESERIVRGADFERRLAGLGLQTIHVPLASFQQAETAKWGAAVRATGISIE